ncbi:MAG: isoleucine--tRNA ligase [bacterium]
MAFANVSSRVNSDELERGVLEYWDKGKIFEKSLERTKDKEPFIFYDGPPYATGKPHYGHILQSAIKDTVLRYKTMCGYHVPRRVGWDCHGLPVETIVEKELGFKTKKDIEDYGIEEFNNKCRDTVFRYIDDFTRTLKRMGRWANYEEAYATLDKSYMEAEWSVFKQLWEQELVYKDFRSTPYCVRCETPLSNFEVASSYRDRTDVAVYVLLRVDQQLSLLIWTTTPWTLPGNAAVAVNAELTYVSVEYEGKEVIVAKERINEVFSGDFKIVREWKVEELLKLSYEPLHELGGAYRVVASEHVSADEGTGLVHIAPAFGEEDADIGKREELSVLRTVDPNGRFTDQVQKWAGESIWQANRKIVEDLEERGLLFKKEQYTHSYPYCWRCDEPLIYYALDTWFVAIQKLKDKMLEAAEQINWTPKHVKQGRFGKGIESAPDWAVSRNRFWSVPMPIWECEKCTKRVCVGSTTELKDLSGVDEVGDMHRPYVDRITWLCSKSCEGIMKRVPEVLDVWFDSGSMPYAVEQEFPADFIVESIEQTRLWFYVLHVLAVALKNGPAFKNAIGSGLIFAEDGQKLSKKLKNYPEPEPTINRYGADALRLYLLSSASLGEPYRFSEKELRQLQRSTYLTLWNVYSFFVRYANTHEWSPGREEKSRNVLDRWISARLLQLEMEIKRAMDDYQVDRAARAFVPFVDDLSNWYVRRSRDRFHASADSDEAFGTLYTALVCLAKLLAPFMPYVAEVMYRNLTGGESVHLERLEKVRKLSKGERKVLDEMAEVRAIVSEGLAARAAAEIKVRQPLARLATAKKELSDELSEIIRDEVNVKELKFGVKMEGETQVKIDTEMTPELKREGLAREIIRHSQVLRRDAGYALDDRITLVFRTDDGELCKVLEMQSGMILEALQADEVVEDVGEEDVGADLKIDGKLVHLGVVKK